MMYLTFAWLISEFLDTEEHLIDVRRELSSYIDILDSCKSFINMPFGNLCEIGSHSYIGTYIHVEVFEYILLGTFVLCMQNWCKLYLFWPVKLEKHAYDLFLDWAPLLLIYVVLWLFLGYFSILYMLLSRLYKVRIFWLQISSLLH